MCNHSKVNGQCLTCLAQSLLFCPFKRNAEVIRKNSPDLAKPLGKSQEEVLQELQLKLSKAKKFNSRKLKSMQKVFALNIKADKLLQKGKIVEAKKAIDKAESLQSEWHDLLPIDESRIEKQIETLINNYESI